MSTIVMKLTSAIVVGGEVVKPPALVEVTEAEARDLARRGKAVAATVADHPPTACTPSAVLVNASEQNPVDATVEIGGNQVPVQIVGQAEDGSPVVTDASAASIEAAALRQVANDAAAALEAAKAEAENTEGKNRARKASDANAVIAAQAAFDAADAAATAAESTLTTSN